MTLEKEINQPSFKSEFQKLAVNMIYTHGWLAVKQKNIFDKYEITVTQFNILRILRGQHPEPIPISILRERMLDKMCDASRLVERLRLKGLVERRVCKADRRKSNVKISRSGLELLKKIDKHSSDFDNIFSNLKTSDAKTINNLLDKLRG